MTEDNWNCWWLATHSGSLKPQICPKMTTNPSVFQKTQGAPVYVGNLTSDLFLPHVDTLLTSSVVSFTRLAASSLIYFAALPNIFAFSMSSSNSVVSSISSSTSIWSSSKFVSRLSKSPTAASNNSCGVF